MNQLDMNFRQRKRDQERASQQQTRVMALLSDGEWHTARSVCGLLVGITDRALRQIAEDSNGEIISGQLGYRLTKFATRKELNHAERWLLSQARHMQERVIQIRRARNRSGKAA